MTLDAIKIQAPQLVRRMIELGLATRPTEAQLALRRRQAHSEEAKASYHRRVARNKRS